MTTYAADYSWARPNLAALKAAGVTTVCRYLSHDRSGKTLKKDELDRIHAAGLAVVLNFEDSPGRPDKGYDAGVADAAYANAMAAALGAPMNVPIYYSCDTDPGNPVRPAIVAYYRGLHDQSRRPVGVYGGAILCETLGKAGTARFFWVANASSWNHGVIPPNAHIHQYYGHPAHTPSPHGVAGGDWDVSEVLNPNHGQWGGTAIPTEDDFLMAISDQDQIKLVGAIADIHDAVVNWLIPIEIDGGYANRGKSTPRTQQILALVSALHGAGGTTDPKALADAVVQNLSPAVAKSVADEIAKRLAA